LNAADLDLHPFEVPWLVQGSCDYAPKRGGLYYVIIKGDFADKKMNILNKA
jgi:hypothetical protein